MTRALLIRLEKKVISFLLMIYLVNNGSRNYTDTTEKYNGTKNACSPLIEG